MAFYTNFEGAIADGELVASGGERQVVVRQILEGIIAATGGRWLEVTDGAPTPVALRPFASSIPSGVTNAATPAIGNQVTLYQADDVHIGDDDGYSRLIRFEISSVTSTSNWISQWIIDTFVRDDLWVQNPVSPGGLMTTPQMGTSAASQLTNDHRLFAFGDDNWLVLALINATSGLVTGVMGFLYPDNVSGFDRDELAYFWAWSAPPNISSSQNGPNIWCAAGSFSGGAAQVIMSPAANVQTDSLPGNQDLQFPFARLEAFQTSTYFSHIQQIPRIRVVRGDLFGNDFLQFDADGATWLVLVRMAGLAICIDITPDPGGEGEGE